MDAGGTRFCSVAGSITALGGVVIGLSCADVALGIFVTGDSGVSTFVNGAESAASTILRATGVSLAAGVLLETVLLAGLRP